MVTTWNGPSGQVGNSSHVTLSGPYAVANGMYQSDVIITAFDPGVHNGEYTCNATVIPSSSYVIGSSTSNGRMVMITGQLFIRIINFLRALFIFFHLQHWV